MGMHASFMPHNSVLSQAFSITHKHMHAKLMCVSSFFAVCSASVPQHSAHGSSWQPRFGALISARLASDHQPYATAAQGRQARQQGAMHALLGAPARKAQRFVRLCAQPEARTFTRAASPWAPPAPGPYPLLSCTLLAASCIEFGS